MSDDVEQAAARRVAFILGYLEDPAASPLYQDPAKVYQVVAAERDHQGAQADALEAQLAALKASAPARAGLERRRDEARRREAKLTRLLAHLAGVPEPPPPRPPDDAKLARRQLMQAAEALRARSKD